MIVAHNLLAENASRQYKMNVKSKNVTMEKLSSGYKVNRAADDAAGLSISEKMRNQIRNLNQAVNNAQDGISLIQVADGAMAEIQSMLHRSTELCTQAANDTNTAEDRAAIQAELNEIITEIDNIADKTRFNNRYLLKGDDFSITTSLPPVIKGALPAWATIDTTSATNGYMSDTYTDTNRDAHVATILDFSNFTPDQIQASVDTGFYTTCCTCTSHYSILFTADATNDVETSGNHYIYKVGLDGAQTANDVYQRILDATNNGNPNSHYTEMIIDNGKLVIYDNRTNVTADANYGKIGPGVAYSSGGDDTYDQGDLYLQVGANSGENLKISLPSISSNLLGISNIDVSTHASASQELDDIHNAIIYVSANRSRMGAYQNRLEYTINNLENYSENLTSAESTIRDTDMATEMTKFSKENILAQIGEAMIAQANQQAEGVLALLN